MRMTAARTAATLTTLALAAVLTGATGGGALAADGSRRPSLPAAASSTTRVVTLVTGDVVRVATNPAGRRAVTLQPGPDGTVPQAAITQTADHLYVVPLSALRLLAAKQLDPALFDVAQLLKDGYDDASRTTLPVIVDFGRGAAAATRASATNLAGARRTHTLSMLGDAAYDTDKHRARQFWASLTTGRDSTGTPTALASGAVHVDLDGRVHVLDVSQPLGQIHAPQAWAAGYDGTGVRVAVLDTGYDPTHPDLQGKVVGSANFSQDASVVDGHGHGTHVASTIVGSGAASAGFYKGVAPGATLLVGKVLGADGYGADSQVLAGMQWAVAQHADVVSMSLGGDTGDGTGPLERAVDDLSATSPTLFVIAAGNNGPGETTVTAPGAAEAALTVGAVDSTDAMASFSGRGPRMGDGGLKPDVVAPGVDIVAARAAGTTMGTPVDDRYTSASGTSMATPHVAGLAALLKQEHPAWDGERLKAAIASSAVPVVNATAFDAGTGRVDALRATQQTVVTDPALDLGFFKWPHATPTPSTKALTYSNLGAAPVTLDLALGSEDGSGGVTGVSLGADTVTVPAGGTASVPVSVDPSVGAPASYSGDVTATVEGSTQTVRTAVGYVLEPERYDLNVTVKPRVGTQTASHIVSIMGLADYSFDQRQLDAAPGDRTVTFRVPPGDYSAGVTSFGTGKDDASEGVTDFDPTTPVHSDTTVVLDESQTRLFSYRTDRPVVSEGSVLSTNWMSRTGVYTGISLYGTSDRMYARPMTRTAGGTVDSQLNFELSQPEGEVTAGGTSLGMRPLTAPGGSVWTTAVPDLTGTFRVVDGGDAANPHTSRAKGSVVLVAGTCSDLTDAAAALAAAGAEALVAYPDHGQVCAGTINGAPPLPSFTMRPVDARRLLTHAGHQASVVTHQSPAYIYDLATAWTDRVPSGAVVDASGSKVATLVEHYNSLGGTSADGIGLYANMIGWVPGLGRAVYGLDRRVDVPSTVTHYVSPGADWEREVVVADDALGGAYADLGAPPHTYAAGTTTEDTWYGGPVTYRMSPLQVSAYGWQAEPNRQGDALYDFMPVVVDSAGHTGGVMWDGEYSAKLYQGGKLVLDAWDPLMFGGFPVPSKATHYRMDTTDLRKNLFWQRSTSVRTVWSFTSRTPKGAYDILPLMSVAYRIPMSTTGTVPKGAAVSFGLTLSMPAGAPTAAVARPTVQVSWDGGLHWRGAAVTGCTTAKAGDQATRCTVTVPGRASGSATLRVVASDANGNGVRQTVVDAYAIG